MQRIWGKDVFSSVAEIVRVEHTALLVVDMQNDFCAEDGYYGKLGKDLSAIQLAVRRMSVLVDAAREAGVLVVWIQQTLLPDARADSAAWLRRRTQGTAPPEWTIDGSWGQEFVAPLVPRAGEPVVKKHRSSAFVGTHLDLILRSNGIASVVIGGAVTQGCVESTARDATFYDYYVVHASDCVGTTDRHVHDASMLCQKGRYDFAPSTAIREFWAGERTEASG
ncbi:cysteine hydrolase family protein [Pseudonocardia sp.]|jgi:nicotinamidase-related amidase|uniref:cysteine hydrolase family protein n=1 Tax=Pseudonocardia sp. TaxID=60912 RepID=UPI003D126B13